MSLEDNKITNEQIQDKLMSTLSIRPTDPIESGGSGISGTGHKARQDSLPLFIIEKLNALITLLTEQGIDTLATDLQAAVDRISANEGDISTLNGVTDTLNTALTNLTSRVSANEDNISTIQGQLTSLLDDINTAIENAEIATTAANNAVDTVNGLITTVNEDIEANQTLRNELADYDEKINHDKGYFATVAALELAYPTAEAGDWARVGGDVDLIYQWDTDTSAWKSTDTQVTLANTTGTSETQGMTQKAITDALALQKLTQLEQINATGNPVNIQNTNEGFVDKVKITNDTASAISSPLTGKSFGKNLFNPLLFEGAVLTLTSDSIIVNSMGSYFAESLYYLPVESNTEYYFKAYQVINSGVYNRRVAVRQFDSNYEPISGTEKDSTAIHDDGYITLNFKTTVDCKFLQFRFGRAYDTPVEAYNITYTELQLELGSTATAYESYTATTFSIPLKDTSGTDLDLNPADVIEMIDGKYHLNDTELHDDSQDALHSIATKEGQTNLIGDQPFTFDVTELQEGVSPKKSALLKDSDDNILYPRTRAKDVTLNDGRKVEQAINDLDSGKQDTVPTATEDNIASFNASGGTKDSGKAFETAVTDSNTKVPTSGAVKVYVESSIANVESGVIYDQVIRTQTDFETLIASPTWLDAKSVALVGQFTLSTTDNIGIKIPATVKQIHGFNSAKITITNFRYNSTTAEGGLWYNTPPTTNEYEIRNLEVDCTGTGTSRGYGFTNCTNLTNCTGTGTGTYGYGFRNCTNLTNCIGTGIGTGTGTTSYGFTNCTNLTNCTGTGAGGTSRGYGFTYCTNLTNCTGTGTGAFGYGFSDITYASNCKDGGSETGMWGGINKGIDEETCRKTPAAPDLTALNA